MGDPMTGDPMIRCLFSSFGGGSGFACCISRDRHLPARADGKDLLNTAYPNRKAYRIIYLEPIGKLL